MHMRASFLSSRHKQTDKKERDGHTDTQTQRSDKDTKYLTKTQRSTDYLPYIHTDRQTDRQTAAK